MKGERGGLRRSERGKKGGDENFIGVALMDFHVSLPGETLGLDEPIKRRNNRALSLN